MAQITRQQQQRSTIVWLTSVPVLSPRVMLVVQRRWRFQIFAPDFRQQFTTFYDAECSVTPTIPLHLRALREAVYDPQNARILHSSWEVAPSFDFLLRPYGCLLRQQTDSQRLFESSPSVWPAIGKLTVGRCGWDVMGRYAGRQLWLVEPKRSWTWKVLGKGSRIQDVGKNRYFVTFSKHAHSISGNKITQKKKTLCDLI